MQSQTLIIKPFIIQTLFWYFYIFGIFPGNCAIGRKEFPSLKMQDFDLFLDHPTNTSAQGSTLLEDVALEHSLKALSFYSRGASPWWGRPPWSRSHSRSSAWRWPMIPWWSKRSFHRSNLSWRFVVLGACWDSVRSLNHIWKSIKFKIR